MFTLTMYCESMLLICVIVGALKKNSNLCIFCKFVHILLVCTQRRNSAFKIVGFKKNQPARVFVA